MTLTEPQWTDEQLRGAVAPGDPEAASAEPVLDDLDRRFPSLDWEAEFARDYSVVEWMPGKFMERGQQAAVIGGGKVGKTLLMHDWVWSVASGRPFLGDSAREPMTVLYFDKENGKRDIVIRMRCLGATPGDLKRIEYKSFPAFSGALDTSAIAAAECLAVVERTKPDLVVMDTASRFIAGKENDADTWLALNRMVQEPLKRLGITYVRLDHFGKDETRGARGSSAKEGDIDHIWELSCQGESSVRDMAQGVETVTTQLTFKRTHSRTGLGSSVFDITRVAQKEIDGPWIPGRTRHTPTTQGVEAQHARAVGELVDQLVVAGVPVGLGRDRLVEWAEANGIKLPGKKQTRQDITAALKARHAA